MKYAMGASRLTEPLSEGDKWAPMAVFSYFTVGRLRGPFEPHRKGRLCELLAQIRHLFEAPLCDSFARLCHLWRAQIVPLDRLKPLTSQKAAPTHQRPQPKARQ